MTFVLRNAGVSKADAHTRVIELPQILARESLFRRNLEQLPAG